MINDFEMIVHQIPGKDDITIVPIYDVHLGSRECNEQQFIEFIDSINGKPNVHIILGGDLIDNGTRNSVTNVFRATMSPSAQKREMAKILEPVRDQILCATDGNHERRNRDVDDAPIYDIMAKLDLEQLYRPNMVFLKIQMGEQYRENGNRTSHYERPSYVFCVTHGSGSVALPGGVLNKNERMGYALDGVDCLVVGHSHKPMVSQPGKIVVDPRNNFVSVKPFKVVVATSWLNYGDYAMQKMLQPTSHALQTIHLSAYKKEMVVTM